MVVSTSTDFSRALLSPLDVIESISAGNADAGKLASEVQSHFTALFVGHDAGSKIPFLDSDFALKQVGLAESSSDSRQPRLVRWRCMIQDTSMGNEVVPRYLGSSSTHEGNALFGAASFRHRGNGADEHDLNGHDLGNMPLCNVSTLYGVSPPAQSAWSRKADHGLVAAEGHLELSNISESHCEGDSTHELMRRSVVQKLPLDQPIGAILKLYGEEAAESLRIGQMIDLIGIVDVCSLPTIDWTNLGDESGHGSLSSSTYLAFHVIALLPTGADSTAVPRDENIQSSSVNDAVSCIAKCIGGDLLAAEYVFLALVARVYARSLAQTMGPMSLNVTKFPAPMEHGMQSKLAKLLNLLLPFVSEQSLSLEHLNGENTRMAPQSDADEYGLKAGRLQLADGTLIIVDENTMHEGELKERGIDNIRALSTVMTTHKLPYHFPYSKIEMDVDLQWLVLSQGKSILSAKVQVPLELGTVLGASEQADSLYGPLNLDEVEVSRVRELLQRVRQRTCSASAYSIPSEVSERIQDDFVKSRTSFSSTSSTDAQESLSQTLEIARLVCLSNGRQALEWQDWTEAKRLEEARKLRLSHN